MPHDLALVSVPDAMLAGVALLLAAYEGFVARAARASGTAWREHAALATLSLCTAAFALGMLVQYNGSPTTALWATRFEMVALVGMAHSMLAFAFVTTGRIPRHAGRAIATSCTVWLALIPWVVADVELRPMLGLAHLFARRVETPLSLVAVLWCVGIAIAASYWLLRHGSERRRDTRWFVAGIAAWSVAGTHDTLMAAFAPVMWPNLLEYGFVGFLVAVVARDVQRHRTMLDRSRRDFRVLIERTPDAVAVVRDDRFVWMNRSCLALLGDHDPDAPPQRWADVVDQPLADRLTREVAHTGEAAGPYDVWLTRTDGERRQASVIALGMHFEDAPATVLVARDVTEERQIVARMIEMDRFITAGSLSAGVGHEINNPLAYSLLNLREARRTAARHDIHELSRLLASSEEGMMRVDGVVRALRSFARPDNPKAAAEVERCVRSAVAIVGNEVRLRAQLDLDLDPTLAVFGGETMLTQIVTSLLVNAAQAIPEGAPEDNVVRVHTHDHDDLVVVAISDTGCGIPPENIHRVFDPFFSTKDPQQGTGLGLSICRDKITELGGSLDVDSVVGRGTTIRVTLPAAPPLASHGTSQSDAPASARSEPSRRRVLIVDDEVALLKALARPMRRHAVVVTASSAEQALTLLETEQFDLVISDLMMPGMSGVALYDRITERWPDTAASMIFMSGGAFTVETRQFCESMGQRVLSKPLDIDRVLAILRQHRPRLTSDVGNGA